MSHACQRFWNCYKTPTFCYFAYFWPGAKSQCACHTKRHLNLQKAVWDRQFWTHLTWKCASQNNGVHFFDIATSKSVRTWCVFCTVWLRNVLRAKTACNSSFPIWPDGSAPATLANLLFVATFLPSRAPASSSSLLFSSLPLPLPLLSSLLSSLFSLLSSLFSLLSSLFSLLSSLFSLLSSLFSLLSSLFSLLSSLFSLLSSLFSLLSSLSSLFSPLSSLLSSPLLSSPLLSSPLLSLLSSPLLSLLFSPLLSSPLLSSRLVSSRLVSSLLFSSLLFSPLLSSPLLSSPLLSSPLSSLLSSPLLSSPLLFSSLLFSSLLFSSLTLPTSAVQSVHIVGSLASKTSFGYITTVFEGLYPRPWAFLPYHSYTKITFSCAPKRQSFESPADLDSASFL